VDHSADKNHIGVITMTKVGLLGGAFNPPTKGHIELAQFVLDNTDIDEIWLTPCCGHMYGKDMESAQFRLTMCNIIAQKDIYVFDYEIKHKMNGSAYEFVNKLLDDPDLDVEFSLIIGQDNANTFSRWKNADKLKDLVKFIVVGRGGTEVDEEVNWYRQNSHVYLPRDCEPCSSTEIRDHFKENGYEPHKFLDDRVFKYIKKYDLYWDLVYPKQSVTMQ